MGWGGVPSVNCSLTHVLCVLKWKVQSGCTFRRAINLRIQNQNQENQEKEWRSRRAKERE